MIQLLVLHLIQTILTPDQFFFFFMSGDVRLIGGRERNFGCVQIFHNYNWGTICSSSWDQKSASVLCRQLGYSGVVQSLVPKVEVCEELHVNPLGFVLFSVQIFDSCKICLAPLPFDGFTSFLVTDASTVCFVFCFLPRRV